MSSRSYVFNGFETTLATTMSDSALSAQLTSVAGLTAPCYLLLDADIPASREWVRVNTINDPNIENVVRNQVGSVGQIEHTAGAVVRGVFAHQQVDAIFTDILAVEGSITSLSGTVSGVASDLSDHAAAADPHAGYVLNSELSDHEAAADPHAGYLLESAFTKTAIDALNIDADTLDTHDSTYFSPTTHDHDADYAAADHVHGYSLVSISNTSGSGNGSYATIVSATFSGLTSGKSYAYHVTGIAVINVNTTNLWEHLVKIGVDGNYSSASTLSLPNGHGQTGGSIPITVAKAGSFVASGTTASVLLQVQTTGLSSQVIGVVNGLALRIS